jgi:hypothetical protein
MRAADTEARVEANYIRLYSGNNIPRVVLFSKKFKSPHPPPAVRPTDDSGRYWSASIVAPISSMSAGWAPAMRARRSALWRLRRCPPCGFGDDFVPPGSDADTNRHTVTMTVIIGL